MRREDSLHVRRDFDVSFDDADTAAAAQRRSAARELQAPLEKEIFKSGPRRHLDRTVFGHTYRCSRVRRANARTFSYGVPHATSQPAPTIQRSPAWRWQSPI